ncbi:hypothetical protein EX30DRAFT_200691 [Ascodesmis nigricans]|uniref:Uncharacterized protein n=1 Tax=Ascodesmis nigricans TaxID=341454 RepID=A0A4S2MKS5_9PEZI|nr:hypothetical protein EX30DRAFT_200691 [Ascodesmis nigricans]
MMVIVMDPLRLGELYNTDIHTPTRCEQFIRSQSSSSSSSSIVIRRKKKKKKLYPLLLLCLSLLVSTKRIVNGYPHGHLIESEHTADSIKIHGNSADLWGKSRYTSFHCRIILKLVHVVQTNRSISSFIPSESSDHFKLPASTQLDYIFVIYAPPHGDAYINT